jgi:hypothetical protein
MSHEQDEELLFWKYLTEAKCRVQFVTKLSASYLKAHYRVAFTRVLPCSSHVHGSVMFRYASNESRSRYPSVARSAASAQLD